MASSGVDRLLRARPPVGQQGQNIGDADNTVTIKIGRARIGPISTRSPGTAQDQQVVAVHPAVSVEITAPRRLDRSDWVSIKPVAIANPARLAWKSKRGNGAYASKGPLRIGGLRARSPGTEHREQIQLIDGAIRVKVARSVT